MFNFDQKTSRPDGKKPKPAVAPSGSLGALESMRLGPETLAAFPQAAPSQGLRYGASNVGLPPYPVPAPMIIPVPVSDTQTINHIFILCTITDIPQFNHAVADIVNILDHANEEDTIVFHLASPGGVLNVAARVVAAMQRSKARIVTRAVGLVASAAAFIWSYGHVRQAVPGAVLMFHMSQHGDMGHTPAIAQNAALFTEYVQDIAFGHLVADGFLTEDEVADIIDRRREIYLSCDEINVRISNGVDHHD